MSVRKVFALAVMGIFSCALSGLAQDIYIAQTAQGSDTGADAADAHSVAWLNTSANWGTGANQVGAGGIVHLCGIIFNPITIQASGVAGNPITIYFEPNCVMTASYWYYGAIIMQSQSYIVINGGVNGVINATNNGSSLAYQTNSAGVVAYSSQNITVENLSIVNMYQRTSLTDETGGYGGEKGVGVYIIPNGEGLNYCSNITVSNCVIHDSGFGAFLSYGAVECSNYLFINNTVYRCSLGAFCGDRGGGSLLSGFTCTGNNIYSFSNWDDTVANDFHHDGIYIFANAANSVCSNIVLNANTIGPAFGANTSAGLFVTGNCPSALLYNNIFVANNDEAPADGFIYLGFNQGGSSGQPYTPGNAGIYNNTFLGGGVGTGILIWDISGTNYFENNIVNSVGTCINYIYAPTNSLVSNYNLVNGLNPSQAFCYSPNFSGRLLSLAGWQSLGFDAQSTNNNPLLNPGNAPQVASPAARAGVNRYSTFTTDYAGNPRLKNGPWTIGAFNVPPTIMVSPPVQGFGAVLVGTTTNQTFVVQNIGGGMLSGNVSVAAPFSVVSGGYYSLAAGQSTNVTVSYNPTIKQTNVVVMTFSGGSGTNITLNGSAVMLPPGNLQSHAPNQ